MYNVLFHFHILLTTHLLFSTIIMFLNTQWIGKLIVSILFDYRINQFKLSLLQWSK